ncbi:MAG: associated Golgi protein [Hyphomicrobiales bacterium]|nr:associated Golgi protein [Hyphomicrobiales bacterium]
MDDTAHASRSPNNGRPAAPPDDGGGAFWSYAPWIAVLAVIAIVAAAWSLLPLQQWLESFSQWVRSFGAAGALAFGLAYVVATLLLVPGAAMTIAGGIAFGWWSAPLVLVSATIGATLAFLTSRYFIHGRVCKLIQKRPRMNAIVEAVDEEGWVALALMRLSPVIPFNVQNYLLGVTNVAVPTYFASTFAGMLPGTLVGTYIGVLGRTASEGETSVLHWVFLGFGLAATVLVVVLISRKAREKLSAKGVGDAT